MKPKMQIHYDTDIGGDMDDACALAMLLRLGDVELVGVTTVVENGGKRAGCAKYMFELDERNDVPVAAGADISGKHFRFNPDDLPEGKNWPETIRSCPGDVDSALHLLKASIESGATIVATGPFTNLALLEQKYPGILSSAKLFLMGGFVFPIRKGYPKWKGNMDYNVQQDVKSARLVFERSNPVLTTISVTVETALRRSFLPRLRAAGAVGEILARQAEVFSEAYEIETKLAKECPALPSDILNFLHDPLACAVATGWDGVEIGMVPLVFEEKDGWLDERIDEKKGKPVKVVTKVDGEAFGEYWLKVVCG